MTNKQEAVKQAAKLRAELDKLDAIINKSESLFDIGKDYASICEALEEEELTLNDFSVLPKERRKKALAQAKIQQLEAFFNGTWKADFSDSSQKKWYPYFEYRTGRGLVLAGSYCTYYGFVELVGFYKDEETADFVGKICLPFYKDLV